MKKLKEKQKKDETKETQEEELRRTFLRTSMPIHTNMAYTQPCFYTKTVSHTYVLHTGVKHTNTFTHRDAFTHKTL